MNGDRGDPQERIYLHLSYKQCRGYTLTGVPDGSSYGIKQFYTDGTGVIRYTTDGSAATASSPSIQSRLWQSTWGGTAGGQQVWPPLFFAAL